MRPLSRTGLLGTFALCAAGSLLSIGYYGAPLVRTVLAGLIGFLIVTGMVAGLRAARRGGLVRDYSRVSSAREPEPASVYYLPYAFTALGDDVGNKDVADRGRPHRVVQPSADTAIRTPWPRQSQTRTPVKGAGPS